MRDPVKPDRQRILVPIDFSESARAAFKATLRFARAQDDLIHVFYMPGFYAKTAEDTALLSNPFCKTAELARRHILAWTKSEESGILVETLAQTGMPDATAIANMAIRMGSTLIVLARRKYTFWERLFSGCPAEQLPRIAPCPVHFVDPTNVSGGRLDIARQR